MLRSDNCCRNSCAERVGDGCSIEGDMTGDTLLPGTIASGDDFKSGAISGFPAALPELAALLPLSITNGELAPYVATAFWSYCWSALRTEAG